MTKTKWGIIGPGAIAHNFADGLKESKSGVLVAIASRDGNRLKTFGDAYAIAADRRHSTYAALAADPDIDAVYISTPHPWHAELSILAMRAGKAVVCEKPAGMNAAEVVAVTEVAQQQGVFFMEAFMYRCHPQIARLLAIIASGEIGRIQHIQTRFGFATKPDPKSRLFDPALGGGGILDVGGYPVSLARLVAGAAIGKAFDDPITVKGSGILGATGVDEVAYGLLGFASGVTAEIACAVIRAMDNSAAIIGDKGRIELPDPWVPGRNAGPSDATIAVTVGDKRRVEQLRHPEHLFTFEAELASRAIADGKREADAPAMSHADSIGNNRTLDRWRQELGYVTYAETPNTNRRLSGTLPKGLPKIPQQRIVGVELPVSKLILGCDNQNDLGGGAIVWDAWMEAGGNAFDTAFVYGGGAHEAVLGKWMSARGVAKDVVVVAKGAHTPYCTPRAIEAQLDASLGRLGIARAPIYIMHRDNLDVPVGEFVDALNRLHQKGRIGIFGGSNWSVARFQAAAAYAAKHGLKPLSILNNNLSLAVMEKPVWNGCITSNTPYTLQFLRDNAIAHFSWSSQARGYFLPEALRNRLPADTAPETCFGSAVNAERRKRAGELAQKYGVSAHNIATAWVLAQTFPSFALVGSRTTGEIASTLPGLGVPLTQDEALWLNLEPVPAARET